MELSIIIDEDESFAEFLEEVLNTFDIHVIFSRTGKDGMNKVTKNINKLDCVFLDMNLPDILSLDVYNNIREKRKDLPLILMGELLVELSNDPYLFFLHKPTDMNDIELLISKMNEIK